MVVKDRILKAILDRSAATANDLFYYNAFTPTVMQSMKTQISEWGLNIGTMIIAFDVWNDIITDNEFVAFFDQISKHQITGAFCVQTQIENSSNCWNIFETY